MALVRIGTTKQPLDEPLASRGAGQVVSGSEPAAGDTQAAGQRVKGWVARSSNEECLSELKENTWATLRGRERKGGCPGMMKHLQIG
jgi:hypothetical protein